MDLIFYILKALAAYLAIIGTWEISQSTIARGGMGNVMQSNQQESSYSIYQALNPSRIFRALGWLFKFRSTDAGVEDMVILKRRFDGGLRILLISLLLTLASIVAE